MAPATVTFTSRNTLRLIRHLLSILAILSVLADTSSLPVIAGEADNRRADRSFQIGAALEAESKLKEAGKYIEAIETLQPAIPKPEEMKFCARGDLAALYIELAHLYQLAGKNEQSENYLSRAGDIFSLSNFDWRDLDSEAKRRLVWAQERYSDTVLAAATKEDLQLLTAQSRPINGGRYLLQHLPGLLPLPTPGAPAGPPPGAETAMKGPKFPLPTQIPPEELWEQKERIQAMAIIDHTVNVGSNGKLDSDGDPPSSPAQVNQLFDHLEKLHKEWQSRRPGVGRNVVIYIHGGLTSKTAAYADLFQHLPWWQANGVYPIYFVWHTDLSDFLRDSSIKPADEMDFGDNDWSMKLISPFLNDDRLEMIAKFLCTGVWEWMKGKALIASASMQSADWRSPEKIDPNLPAASLFVSRLAQYVGKYPDTKVHLVGHSAGAIYCAGLLESLSRNKIRTSTVSLLAPALRIGDFQKLIVPHLAEVDKVSVFNLSNDRELKDSCTFKGVTYHKSLLCMVAKALESPAFGEPKSTQLPGFVPLLGLDNFRDKPMTLASESAESVLRQHAGSISAAPCASPPNAKTNAWHHGEFPIDVSTMDSVVKLVRSTDRVVSFREFLSPSF